MSRYWNNCCLITKNSQPKALFDKRSYKQIHTSGVSRNQIDLKPMLTSFVDFVWVDLSLNHIRLLSFIKVNHQGIPLCARGKVVIINSFIRNLNDIADHYFRSKKTKTSTRCIFYILKNINPL